MQHPPFPQVWCGPPNRAPCMPVAQADGPIPMHECRPLSPPGCVRIRLRIPPSLSWRNIGACRSAGPPNSRLFARISSADAQARTRPAQSVDLLAKPRATGRCEARVAVLTERRRRCAHAAPIWQHSGAAVRLGRPGVVGAVQVAPTPRIRLREVQRCGGGEAHGASNSRPSNLKLALVAYWYGPAVCAESSRHIWHIRIVNARPGARTRLRSTGRPLPAYSRRLVSLQAARSLCQAYGMHASRRQQQACG